MVDVQDFMPAAVLAEDETPSVPSLAGSAVPTPSTSADSPASEGRPGDDSSKDAVDVAPQDGVGTPRPEPRRFEDEVTQLRAKLEALEKQTQDDRERQRLLLESSYSRPQPIIPSMSCWDRFFTDAYVEPNTRKESIQKAMPTRATGPQHIDGRKKVIIGMLETELEWLKVEDQAINKLLDERGALQERNQRVADSLMQAEEKLRKFEAAEKAKAAESGKDDNEEEKTGEEAEPATKASEEESAATMQEEHCMPELNRVEWDLFASRLGMMQRSIGDTYAIDVLEGDPVITFQYRGWAGRKSYLEEANPAPRRRQLPPGQGPLPERIRINSPHILRILESIEMEGLGSTSTPLIMIRPYKALVYHEEEIRKVYDDLKNNLFGPPAEGSKDEGVPAAGEEKAPDGEKSASGPNKGVAKDAYIRSPVALEQLQVLIDFLDTEIKQKADYVRSIQCTRVSFTDVWSLFRPGDEVIDQGWKQAYRIIGVSSPAHKVIPPWRNFDPISAKSDETPMMLHCVHVDFDGKFLGPVLQTFEIARFEGEKPITSLRVYPLRRMEGRRSHEPGAPSFREKLAARGKMFTEVLSVKHMHYNGFTLETRDEVDGQVMIDFEESFASEDKNKGAREGKGRTWRPTIQSVLGAELHETKDTDCNAGCCTGENVHKDSYAEKKRNENFMNSLIPEERSGVPSVVIYPRTLNDLNSPDNALTEDDYVIMSYRVFGFILRSRKWAKLDLTYLKYESGREGKHGEGEEGTKKRETAFDQLVLEAGHKKVLLSLIAQHFRDKESATTANEQVDIIRGKGKGLIILLHGAPGVGKTTTAEGVAELFQRPLFQITCGDLGTTAESVEAALETNFSLANRWKCILLLDEADVFLAKRTPQDFIRNGLVSVFLRVLEYYAGILFLTTNRIGDFDEAFGSRIHISLHYPQLKLQATKEIFELNLRLIQQRFADKNRNLVIEKDPILESAEKYWITHKKMRWNGRQIRNACQTALALAEFDAQGGDHERIVDPNAVVKLTVKHLEVVSAAYLEFTRYLKKLYKTDQDRLAQKRGLRARELDGKRAASGKKADFRSYELSDFDSEFSDGGEPEGDKDQEPESTPAKAASDPAQLSSAPGSLASPPTVSSPGQGPSGAVAVAKLEALANEQQAPAAPPQPANPYMYMNPAYAQGYPQSFPQGGPAGFGAHMGGPQQQAQMWQNMNPALWGPAMMGGQMAAYGPQPGTQQPPGGGPAADGTGPPGPRPS